MEQSKHSEESIIKLGEKLIKELNLEYSSNTLARWMSHYIAELISGINAAESESEKKQLMTECCDVILKLWSNRDDLPIKQPLEDLKPVLEILKILQEDKEPIIIPRWLEYNAMPRDNEWTQFVDLVKNNSEKIFSKVVQINLHKDILLKDQEWMKENKEFLTREQISFLEMLEVFSDFDKNMGVVDLNNFKMSDDNISRVDHMFKDLEDLLEAQKNELARIKENFYKKNGEHK
ncbi:hypothetical protein EGI15_02700 [Chryseobacterium cucumeris]|uniref:Uncharacterized protein n=1 Tax=Chryseobacterium cucumeris TaxID=1813611 RepID=A0ABX9XBN8_9FLAO|nr:MULTISPECIES: hypothetical protein [Weeksellaceae]KFC33382.1 hypothetical protein FF18_09065 [Elizabethkingia anophelis]MDV3499196.1 hypothetical protein [Elizabethkingia anophelis]RKE81590.1 hypothetical protein DEU39_1128 [Chryseobacterium sp. AG363]ROH94787.1 hypothetical protein EGI15_02700 [Chryseobacterium cucumeris]